MKMQYLIVTMFLGVVLAVHLGMNGKVMQTIGNERVGNAVFWCIGAATAVVIGLTGWKSGALAPPLKEIHPILLTAGCMGACLVFGIGVMFPKIGGLNVMLCLLAGQVVAGMVLSHYGWLGSPLRAGHADETRRSSAGVRRCFLPPSSLKSSWFRKRRKTFLPYRRTRKSNLDSPQRRGSFRTLNQSIVN